LGKSHSGPPPANAVPSDVDEFTVLEVAAFGFDRCGNANTFDRLRIVDIA
jgi:hypothetical protein